MKTSWKFTAALLMAAFGCATAQAQWFGGPSLNGPSGANPQSSGNPAAPPVVSFPPVATAPIVSPSGQTATPPAAQPSALATPPAAAVPQQQPYNPIIVQPRPAAAAQAEALPIPAGSPTTSPQAIGATPMPTPYPMNTTPAVPQAVGQAPVGVRPATPYAGSGSYSNRGPSSYTLPTYSPATTSYGPPPVPQIAAAPGATYGQSSLGPSPYSSQGGPSYGQPGLPPGNLSKSELHPFSRPPEAPSWSAWVPTKVASLMPKSWTGGTTSVAPQPPACDPYNYSGAAACQQPSASCGGGRWGCGPYMGCEHWYDNLAIIGSFDAFKGPVDLDGLNANFGRRVGAFGAFPILREWGLGGQLGATAGWYDWKGSLYTGDDNRFQNFITAGVFQRSCRTGLGWAIVHDWLNDDFYADLHLSQFRVAGSWQFNCDNEIGVWAALPQANDEAFVGAPAVQNRFEPVMQGNVYWRHTYSDWSAMTIYAGLAESPSDIPTGANVEVAMNCYMTLFGSATYIWPGSGGAQGRQEEIWNLSLGVALYPGTAMQSIRSQFRPFLPMADNGNFGVWRR